MASNSQAQADSEAEMMVDDPLDASNDPNQGATELDNYFDEVNNLEMGEESFESEEDTSHNPESDETDLFAKEDSDDDDSEEKESSEGEGKEESETEDESQEEEEQPSSKSDRFRIRAKDDVEAEALSIRKRHPEWSLKECIAKAEQILGVEEKSHEEESEAREEPLTVAKISEQINDLRAKRDQANLALEVEEAAEIQRQIDALQDQREEIRFTEKTQESAARRKEIETFEAQYKASEDKAVRLYPDTTNPDSDLVARMVELDAQMREMGDPIYHSPDKPFLLAKKAALELGIIMANPAEKPAVKKTPAKNGAPIQPASGSARTTATNTSTRTTDAIDRIQDISDYDAYVESLVSR